MLRREVTEPYNGLPVRQHIFRGLAECVQLRVAAVHINAISVWRNKIGDAGFALINVADDLVGKLVVAGFANKIIAKYVSGGSQSFVVMPAKIPFIPQLKFLKDGNVRISVMAARLYKAVRVQAPAKCFLLSSTADWL